MGHVLARAKYSFLPFPRFLTTTLSLEIIVKAPSNEFGVHEAVEPHPCLI